MSIVQTINGTEKKHQLKALVALMIYTVPICYLLQVCIIERKFPGPMSVAGALIIAVSFVIIVVYVLSGRV